MCIWVRSRRCGCLVTWFCYQMIAKPGNKTAAASRREPYICIAQSFTKNHRTQSEAWTETISCWHFIWSSLRWRHNGHSGVSNHQPHHCLLNCLFGCRSKKISKLPVTGLCAGNSPETGEFPTQMASNTENVSIWWHHHDAKFCAPYIAFFCTQ